VSSIRTGAPSSLRFRYHAEASINQVSVLVGVYSHRGESAAWLSTEMSGSDLRDLPATGTIVCWFDRSTLLPGRYTINVHVSASGEVADYLQDAAVLQVAEGDFFGTGRLPPPEHGAVLVDHRWTIDAP
jgi:lipopolysaccharide transport system ATP-binding protein